MDARRRVLLCGDGCAGQNRFPQILQRRASFLPLSGGFNLYLQLCMAAKAVTQNQLFQQTNVALHHWLYLHGDVFLRDCRTPLCDSHHSKLHLTIGHGSYFDLCLT